MRIQYDDFAGADLQIEGADLDVETVRIEASRARAYWSVEAEQDLRAWYNLDENLLCADSEQDEPVNWIEDGF